MKIASVPSLSLTCTMIVALAGAAFLQPLAAQTASRPAARSTAHRPVQRSPAPACAKVPVLSPKIPALPAGVAPCARALYSITSSTGQLSPLLGAALRENLEKLNQSFALDYIETKIGTGELAQPHKYYTVNYTGYLIDGSKFDSSFDHPDHAPITFAYGAHRVIQGWDTGFEGMHVGGKRRLFVPFQLAYGEQGRPPQIPPRSELVFDLELVSQSDTPPAPKTPPATPGGTPGAAPGSAPPGSAPTASPQGAAPATAAPSTGAVPGTTTTPPPPSPPRPTGAGSGASATPAGSSAIQTTSPAAAPSSTPPRL